MSFAASKGMPVTSMKRRFELTTFGRRQLWRRLYCRSRVFDPNFRACNSGTDCPNCATSSYPPPPRAARRTSACLAVARGEEDERSDVDFLVFLERGRTLLDLVRLEDRLERLLGRPVDVVTEASLTEPIRSRALREAVRV